MGSVDCFFGQGDSHDICEDYATCGVFDEKYPYAIVCDGCSSAENADFDARILAASIKNNLDNLLLGRVSPEDFAAVVAGESAAIKRTFRFDNECCYATALLAYIKDRNFIAHIWGDGVVVVRREDGYSMYQVEYPSEAPVYLPYGLDIEEFNKGFVPKFGAEYRIICTDLDENFRVTHQTPIEQYKQDNPFVPVSISTDSDIDLIAIFSDGIKSFRTTTTTDSSKASTPIDAEKILANVLAFKGTKGKFVKRRCKKFSKEIKLTGWSNYDDFSMGAIAK